MKYKVTKHYLKTKEVLIATFIVLNDANIFVAKKIMHDEVNRTKALYRVYDDNELLEAFNNEIQELIDPEDAESFNNGRLSFHVMIQPMNSLERISIAYFYDEEDADLFVREGSLKDDNARQGTTFLIFKREVLIATLNKKLVEKKALKDHSSSGSSRGASLSPLATRPTPPGGPADYWIENNENDQ